MKQPDTGNAYIAEIADFMFATKSLSRISKGQGSWGDLLNVGITAASFVVLPAKITMLSAKALTAVIKASTKVVASDAASVAAKRAAAKTLDDALTMKRQGFIPTGKEPVERVGRAGLGEPTPAYQVAERTVPTEAAKAEKGLPDKKYTRTSDEEVDPFKRDVSIEEEAADAVNASRSSYKAAPEPGTPKGSAEELKTKYVANPKKTFEQKSRADLDEAAKSEMYDKTKFTQAEIDDRIAGLSKKELDSPQLKRQPGESKEDYRQKLEDYVRGGDIEDLTPIPFARIAMRKTGEYTDDEIKKAVDTFRRYVREPAIEKDAKEVTYLYLGARRMLKDIKLNSKLVPEDRRISRADLKVIKESFGKLKKEFKEKVVDTAEGKALLKKIEKEMPSEPKSKDVLLKYEENLMDDAKPGELKTLVDEAIDDSPITTTAKGPIRTGRAPVKIKDTVPDDLKIGISSDVERAASLLSEKSKLNAFNATNTNKLKTASQQEVSQIKQSSARNKKIIQRIDDELREIRSSISSDEKRKAQEIADEITKRNLAKRSEKYGPFEGPIKLEPSKPGKGGDTAKLTTKGKIAKARAEVERLREEWKSTPASDTEARSRLAREAKKFADYIKKLEGN
jgi:predicted DNA-binding protein